MKKTLMICNQVYHIYNRGVDKRKIFLDKKDYRRFVEGLIVFNDTKNLNGERFKYRIENTDKHKLVNIIAYCLMPNHLHLLLEQIEIDGITRFIKKLSTSYVMYFNNKYERTGALIQGVFKRSHIRTDAQLLEISRYIHLNPVKILPIEKRHEILEYPWSSMPEYIGNNNGLSVISNQKIVLGQFKTQDEYRKYVVGPT